jgi:hypothetical protein
MSLRLTINELGNFGDGMVDPGIPSRSWLGIFEVRLQKCGSELVAAKIILP